MTAKGWMILRDVTYAILIVLLLLPGDLNPFPGIELTYKIIIAVLAAATRVWQHVNYYKATGKIY
jgi:hypothetical protein